LAAYIDDVAMYGTETPLFYGWLSTLTPELTTEPGSDVQATVYDLLRLLAIRKVSTTCQIGQTTGALVDLLLNSLGWEGLFTVGLARLDYARLGGPSTNWRNVDTGRSTIPYVQYTDTVIATALRELVEAEHGQFYVRGDGYAVFEDRHHRLKTRTSVATLDDSMIAAITGDEDETAIVNHVEVIAYPRRVGTPAAVVWSARCQDNPQKLASGETKRYYPSYTVSGTDQRCEVTDLIDPTGADMAASAAETGTGVDMTVYLTMTLGEERSRKFVEIKNIHDTKEIYVTLCQLRGTPLIQDDQVSLLAIDAASVAEYQECDQRVTSKLISDPGEAQDYANYLLLLGSATTALTPWLVGLLDLSYAEATGLLDMMD
jgi:hypothetical protein